MAKPRTPRKADSAPEESDPEAPFGSTDSTLNEPVNLSMLEGGVLHNPPQATQSQETNTTDEK